MGTTANATGAPQHQAPITTTHRPSECPACGAAVKLASDKRTQFDCYALAVRLDGPEGWLLREACALPSRRSDVAPAAPTAPNEERPSRVVVALFGNIRDWNDLKRRFPGNTRMFDIIKGEAWPVTPAAI